MTSAVRRSFVLSAAESYVAVALQLASTIIVSRILTPSDVGIFAIAAVFAGLASTFRDFGVAEYLIQEKDLTRERIRAAYAVNIAISWAMSLAMFALAPLAASFYGNDGIRHVMWIQALNFLVVPFGAITLAWFRRSLDYTPIVWANLMSSVTSFVVVVGMAAAGFGFYSLAWASFAGVVAGVVVATLFRPSDLPKLPGLKEVRRVFDFGKFTSATYLMVQLGKGAPELIIGRAGGVADVGMFSRANGLLEMFNRLTMKPLLQVCLPYFAMQDRERGSIAQAYGLSVSLLTAVGWPVLGALAVMSYCAVRIVYGPQWLDAASIASVVCLAGAIDLTYLLAREALVARGEAKRASIMQMQLVSLQVGGLLAVVPFGLIGAAWGLVGASICGVFVASMHLRAIGVRPLHVSAELWPSARITLVSVLPLAAASWVIPIDEFNFVAWAAAGGLYFLASWLVTTWATKHRLWIELSAIAARALKRLASRA